MPSPVKAAALELGLPVTDRVDDVLDADVPLGVVVAFGRLIKPHVLEAVPMVNLHFSLLPRWRGAAPVERAILAGDERTGVDLMAVEEGLDTGGTYRRTEVPIGPDDTLEELRRPPRGRGHPAPGRRRSARASARPTPQVGEPTYADKLTVEDRHLDWSGPAVDVHRRVRLGDAWTTHDGKRLKVWRTHVPPVGDGPRVRAADGEVELVEVQPEGKGRMDAKAWANGARFRTRRPARHVTLTARQLALDALDRIERDGAYANLLLPELLQRSSLEARDRHFATELVYGTTRMKRACDFLVDRFVARELDLRVRNALRLGAYQLHFLADAPARRGGGDGGDRAEGRPRPGERGPPPGRRRRRSTGPTTRPASAIPTGSSIGSSATSAARTIVDVLERMNQAPPVTERADGYVQDLASQWVAEAVGAQPGERVADLCAAPGRQGDGARGDRRHGGRRRHPQGPRRSDPLQRPGPARSSPPTPLDRPCDRGSFDRVLVDAPCSGLGHPASPSRRPVADRCRRPGAPGGGAAVDRRRGRRPPEARGRARVLRVHAHRRRGTRHRRRTCWRAIASRSWRLPPTGPGRPTGHVGHRVLPHVSDTDGMYLLRLRLSG